MLSFSVHGIHAARWAAPTLGLLVLAAGCAVDPLEGATSDGIDGSSSTHGGAAEPEPDPMGEVTSGGDEDDTADPPASMCEPPPPVFSHTLCVCDDLADAGALRVRGSMFGPATVGVNRRTTMIGDIEIQGSATLYGGVRTPSRLDVEGDLSTVGTAEIAGYATVGGDLDVGEDLVGLGFLDLGGQLRVAGRRTLLGLSRNAGLGVYSAPEEPCACGEDVVFDVADAVADAAGDNDNEVVGLPTDVTQIGVASLRLPTGRYYVRDVDGIGVTRFVIDGDVSLFVDGSLDLIGLGRFDLEPGASFDLFVAGSVRTIGQVRVGQDASSGSFRIYLGGDEPFQVAVGDERFYASIYAPRASLAYVGNTEIVGSVFARDLLGLGRLVIGGVGLDGECDPDDPGDPNVPDPRGPGEPDEPSDDPPDDPGAPDDPGDPPGGPTPPEP